MSLSSCALLLSASSYSLFPKDLPPLEWVEFEADGFDVPVSGVIYHPDKPVDCGVPLGGIGTGSLDIMAEGLIGFEIMFNQWPRWPQYKTPFLGVSVGGETTVLTAQPFIDGGTFPSSAPFVHLKDEYAVKAETTVIEIENVKAARDIHYFGHYPVVDLEYDVDAPVEVAMRGWSPFIPGDAAASNIPAAVFEVHLRNKTKVELPVTLAFSFPGIHDGPSRIRREVLREMVGTTWTSVVGDLMPEYKRTVLAEPVHGVAIDGPDDMGYVLGVIDENAVRVGKHLRVYLNPRG